MEWLLIILWLSIINGGLGGQYILNWMGNQQRFVGNQPIGVSPGVMTWWRELSKLLWAVIAVTIEVIRGKKIKYLWPGTISMVTIVICAFTGVIENVGFFYLPRYYSPHLFAPYVNVYLALLPFFGKVLFNAPIRKAHWIGILLVITGLSIPYLPRIFGGVVDPKSILDGSAIIWILIINCCLFSQQILNNKTVQTAFKGVGPNALVLWREIWKMVFITSALFIIPFIGDLMKVNIPDQLSTKTFESRVLPKLNLEQKEYLLNCYVEKDDSFFLKKDLAPAAKENIKEIFAATEYHRFFSLFQGSIIPKNWWP
ncbi:hypothetical protein C0389_08720, partial [bacterium]|nr:hypothetical protein [bacterium]